MRRGHAGSFNPSVELAALANESFTEAGREANAH